MNKWIWIGIIVAVAIVAFVIGRNAGKKSATPAVEVNVIDHAKELTKKKGMDTKASQDAGKDAATK